MCVCVRVWGKGARKGEGEGEGEIKKEIKREVEREGFHRKNLQNMMIQLFNNSAFMGDLHSKGVEVRVSPP